MIDVITHALQYYGEGEKTKGDNPLIVKWLARTKVPRSQIADETAWCAAFASAMLDECGYNVPALARARSFLEIGQEKPDTEKSSLGDVIVFSRGSVSGHVAFFIRLDLNANQIWVLGGNQKNRVGIDPYPISSILSRRQLIKPTAR